MTLLIISIILFLALLVVIIVVRGFYFTTEIESNFKYNETAKRDEEKKKFNKRTVAYACFSPLMFLILLFGLFVKIPANTVGIVYHDHKGILTETKKEGFQQKSIFEHITLISTTNREKQVMVAGQTSDSAYADVDITVVYRIDPENAGKFYKRTNSDDISETQLTSLVKEALQSSTIKYDIYAILGDKLEDVRVDFTRNLTEIMMERYSITVVSTSFNDIDAGTRIEEIIKNKAEALQQIEIAEAQKQQAEVEKEKALIEAEAKAEAEKIAAQAQADIIRIEAEAEAQKTKIEKQAIADAIQVYVDTNGLTPEEAAKLYEYIIWVQKWDGEVPTVSGSDNGFVVVPGE